MGEEVEYSALSFHSMALCTLSKKVGTTRPVRAFRANTIDASCTRLDTCLAAWCLASFLSYDDLVEATHSYYPTAVTVLGKCRERSCCICICARLGSLLPNCLA